MLQVVTGAAGGHGCCMWLRVLHVVMGAAGSYVYILLRGHFVKGAVEYGCMWLWMHVVMDA